jgi:hypothetical protein
LGLDSFGLIGRSGYRLAKIVPKDKQEMRISLILRALRKAGRILFWIWVLSRRF